VWWLRPSRHQWLGPCPSSASFILAANFRQMWLQKLSNKGLSLPCTQLASRISVSCSAPPTAHSKMHLRAEVCVSNDPTSEICIDAAAFFRRAERDHVFCVAQTRRGGVRRSASSGTTRYDAPSIDWKIAMRDLWRRCAECASGNGCRSVLRDGWIPRKAAFCTWDTLCQYRWAGLKIEIDKEL